MICARFEFKGGALEIRCSEINLKERRQVSAEDQKRFEAWIENYSKALDRGRNQEILLHIGQEIYDWLDDTRSWMERLIAKVDGPPLIIELRVRPNPSEEDLQFLEVPWELLANQGRHLAADPILQVCPVRRMGAPGDPKKPSESRLSTVFMAAAPRGGGVPLSYEAEESAMLDASGSEGMDLTVEESGNLSLLAECLARERPVDVLHLSCHGTHSPDPALLLEDEEGNRVEATAQDINESMGDHKPRLLFLSACKTSEPNKFVNTFSSNMIRYGVPAVLGWGGSVQDDEATLFAEKLYGFLARSNRMEGAVAMARLALLEPDDPKQSLGQSRDWHLARLYMGKRGGGVLCKGRKARRPGSSERGHREFLNTKDKQIPVAGLREFVGRRRQIQNILTAFRRFDDHAGVLIHGFGRQGKSSLAARIANRMPDHQAVVVYGNYEASAVLKAFESFLAIEGVERIVDYHRDNVSKDPRHLKRALRALLEGPCCDLEQAEGGSLIRRFRNFLPDMRKDSHRDKKCGPVLLIIDDFEQILTDPRQGERHRVMADHIDVVRAIIEAFDGAKTLSRLLITSRYQFTLPSDQDKELAERLFDLPLPAMEEYEGRKQAAAKAKYGKTGQRRTIDLERIRRCIQVAKGNPGLQDLLFSMSLEAPEACDRALADMETYTRSGQAPEEKALLEFLENLAVDHLLGLLSESEKALLRASTLFEIPVPIQILSLMADSAALKASGFFGERLFALGLWEVYEDIMTPGEVAVGINALARPKVGTLNEKEVTLMASASLVQHLFECWGGTQGCRPYAADYELARLAIFSKAADVLAATAENALLFLEKTFRYRTAADLARTVIALLDGAGTEVSPGLLRLACERCHQVGDVKTARAMITRCAEALHVPGPDDKPLDIEGVAAALITQARLLVQDGRPDEALPIFEQAGSLLKSEHFQREYSIVLGDIARIRVSKGEVEAALKLHEERLRVFEELGDLDSKAATLWDIAQVALKQQSYQKAFDYLSESYRLNLKIGRLDGICFVGMDLGMLLCQAGQREQGLEILTRSRDGFIKLGQQAMASRVEEMIDSCKNGKN